jgi:pyruvate dehydrogenase E1 component beta subunit
LKVIVPSTAPDLKGLLKSAIRDDNPVLCFEDANLWGRKGRGPLPADQDHLVPLGVANVRRPGSDVTVVGIGQGALLGVNVAERMAAEDGVDVEVIDPRTLVPMDWPAIEASVRRTGRLVVVDPATRTCSAASEIAAHVADTCFSALRAPVVRVTTDDTHVPFSPALEPQIYPTEDKVLAAVRRTLA